MIVVYGGFCDKRHTNMNIVQEFVAERLAWALCAECRCRLSSCSSRQPQGSAGEPGPLTIDVTGGAGRPLTEKDLVETQRS